MCGSLRLSRIDSEINIACGSYEALASNLALKTNEKLSIDNFVMTHLYGISLKVAKLN